MTLEQRKHFEYVRDVMHGDEEKEDKFCDNNCVWTDHHPDCVRSNTPEPVGFVVDLYNGVNTPSLPPTATVAWLNDNPKIGQILYTKPPQRKPLTDWIDPNDKTQKQYLPNIGEPVLFCHSGKTYCGHHNGGSFQNKDEYFNTWECRWMYLPAAHGIKE